jgi:hypothetical protein
MHYAWTGALGTEKAITKNYRSRISQYTNDVCDNMAVKSKMPTYTIPGEKQFLTKELTVFVIGYLRTCMGICGICWNQMKIIKD